MVQSDFFRYHGFGFNNHFCFFCTKYFHANCCCFFIICCKVYMSTSFFSIFSKLIQIVIQISQYMVTQISGFITEIFPFCYLIYYSFTFFIEYILCCLNGFYFEVISKHIINACLKRAFIVHNITHGDSSYRLFNNSAMCITRIWRSISPSL